MTAARIDEVRIILRYVLVVTILFAKPFILPRGNRGLDIAVTKRSAGNRTEGQLSPAFLAVSIPSVSVRVRITWVDVLMAIQQLAG